MLKFSEMPVDDKPLENAIGAAEVFVDGIMNVCPSSPLKTSFGFARVAAVNISPA
jgi:hypothetical protein